MPLQQQKPYTPWTIAIIVAMFAAFVVFVFIATGVLGSNHPRQPKTPGCLANERCWPKTPADMTLADVVGGETLAEKQAKLAAIRRYSGCYRERLYNTHPNLNKPDGSRYEYFDRSVVYQPADGKQPWKRDYEKTQTMTWETGEHRFCAGINSCARPVENEVRYTQANCRG